MLAQAEMKLPNPFRAAAAAFRAFFHRGPLLVPEDQFEERRGICRRECDQFDRSCGQCKVCTCFVDVKARFATEKCPLGKWD